MEKIVKVVEECSSQVLFSASFEEQDKAYKFAHQMEQMGISVKVLSPTVTESLAMGLGQSPDQLSVLGKILDEEISDH